MLHEIAVMTDCYLEHCWDGKYSWYHLRSHTSGVYRCVYGIYCKEQGPQPQTLWHPGTEVTGRRRLSLF